MQTHLLSDSALLSEAHRLCALERKTTLEILILLREIESRALFARGHSSLFEFCVKELGFSEDQAHRRISAMRLMNAVPEVQKQIASGELKISQLAQVQTYLRAEKKARRPVAPADARNLLQALAGKSARETERELLDKSPALRAQRQTQERVRPITASHTEVKFVADAELLALLNEARGLLAHAAELNPRLNTVFKRVLADWIARRKKEREEARRRFTLPATSRVGRSRYIAAPDRRWVHARAGGQCEYIGSAGARCVSRHALEVHHVRPYARGGSSRATNLKLYCRVHNAAQARWDFGPKVKDPRNPSLDCGG